MSAAKPATPLAALAGVRPSAEYLPELESLRGIAIVLVYAFHVDGVVLFPWNAGGRELSPALAFVRAGHTGVDLFFILSAFLLSLPFLAEARGERPVNRGRYFARRALRILPLYYVAVVVGAVMTASRPADLERALPYLAFINSVSGWYTALPPYSDVWWSLCTEVQFYLALPVVGALLRSRGGRWLALALLAGYALAYAAFLGGRVHVQGTWGQRLLGYSLFGRAPVFLAGMAAAWLYLARGDRLRAWLAGTRWVAGGGADLALLGLLTALGYLLRWAVMFREPFDRPPDHVWHLPEAVLWSLVLLLLLCAPLRSKWLFSNALLARLGILSYSIYMIHLPLTWLFLGTLRTAGVAGPYGLYGWSWRTTLVVVVETVTCLGLAALTYRVIERPFLTRKARLGA